MNGAPRPAVLPRLGWLTAFAVAMGWLEGVVVVYIRAILGLAHSETIPPAAEVMRRFAERPWLLPTEQTREAATLVMLVAAAWLSAPTRAARFGALLIAFGLWDLSYYLALYAMLRWPPTLATMDLLFLLPPHPWWYQPVWMPVAISCLMIGAGLVLFGGRSRGLPASKAQEASAI